MSALPRKNLRTLLVDAIRWNIRGGFAFQVFRLLEIFPCTAFVYWVFAVRCGNSGFIKTR